MRKLPRALLAGGLGFAVSLIIAACGGGAGLLSGNQASTLNNQLSQISGDIQAGHCGAAQKAANQLLAQVQSLGGGVSAKLRQDLALGASTISRLTPAQCHQVTAQSTPPPSASTPTTGPSTTPTTAPTTPTTPTTAPTTPTTPTTTPTTGTTTTPSGGGALGGGPGSGHGGAGTGSGSGSGGGGGPAAGSGTGAGAGGGTAGDAHGTGKVVNGA